MPQPAKNAAKKRPIPTRRSPVVKGGKMPAPTHAGAEDDVKITALKLPPGTLSAEMDAYFKKCDEKLVASQIGIARVRARTPARERQAEEKPPRTSPRSPEVDTHLAQ